MLAKYQKRFKCLELVSIFFLVQIIYVVAVYGDDFYVSASKGSDVTGDGSGSNPWKTIQHAVDNTPYGTEANPTNIHVWPGVYRESVMLRHGGGYQRLLGSGAKTTTITSSPEIFNGDIDGDGRVTQADARVLQNIIVGNRGPILIEGDINEDGKLTVHDAVKLLNLSSKLGKDPCVYLSNGHNFDMEISGFTITGGDTGIDCRDMLKGSLTITNNIITGNSLNGIYWSNFSSAIDHSFTITNNIITGNGTEGIYIGCFSLSTLGIGMPGMIINNRIEGNGENGICCDLSSPTITNNTISNNYCGIRLSESSSTITNNTISNNYCGISLSTRPFRLYYSSPTITNNTITGNSGGRGIYCGGNSSPKIIGNTITGNSAKFYREHEEYVDLEGYDWWNSFSSIREAGSGGGIFCSSTCTAIISGGSITGNYAEYIGGGVSYDSSSSTLNVDVSGNECGWVTPCDEVLEGYYFVQDTRDVWDWARPLYHKFTALKNGSGSVSFTPSGGCFLGTNPDVTLTAIPYEGWRFDHWTHYASGNKPTIIITLIPLITMDRDNPNYFVQANFVKLEEQEEE